MINKYIHTNKKNLAIFFITVLFLCQNSFAQPGFHPFFRMGPPPVISFGIHLDPVISWFATDTYEVRNDGAVPGYNFGISYNRYFGPNYSFSSGINIISAGGRLVSKQTTYFELRNNRNELVTVLPGEAIIYRIKYLAIPLGLKLETNEVSYGTIFADIGLDPKIVIEGRADIPSLNIKGGNALPELRAFNLSYHLMAGIEYPLEGNTAVVLGLAFENNFVDITKDRGDQPWDLVTNKLFSFRIGINF
jgi:hypothetical protein